ncbi:hypothetical protein GMORB2_3885 [Geosmithia morbida]|uniref:Uncharacterized protein n=1 Tax=Geosmithia morbida TaxID=1094350 RepID=A0A9P4YXS8_9HYPO|nr:uncharacterized protein GMORB2_3885 [Geosmithia morbida]KAF4125046.1 hypothetical protein GMORB2_3885 [Geosmithia morbida]
MHAGSSLRSFSLAILTPRLLLVKVERVGFSLAQLLL